MTNKYNYICVTGIQMNHKNVLGSLFLDVILQQL